MVVNAILAHDDKFGIGKNGKLPWPYNPADMKWFRECTTGHVVVMGRKTWESIGSKKLPNRKNVVITSTKLEGEQPDCVYNGDMTKFVSMIRNEYPDVKTWIIGGAEVYKQTIPMCDHVYMTHVKGDFQCDTFLPIKEYLNSHAILAKREQEGLTFSIWKKM